jgi:hypothetical protein
VDNREIVAGTLLWQRSTQRNPQEPADTNRWDDLKSETKEKNAVRSHASTALDKDGPAATGTVRQQARFV